MRGGHVRGQEAFGGIGLGGEGPGGDAACVFADGGQSGAEDPVEKGLETLAVFGADFRKADGDVVIDGEGSFSWGGPFSVHSRDLML